MRYIVRGTDYYIRATRNMGSFVATNEKSIKNVVNEVCRISGYYKHEIVSRNRNQELVEWRAIASYICKKCGYGTYNAIGKELGGLDHSSIMHHCAKVQNLLDCKDKKFIMKFNAVKHLIK